MSKVSYVYEVIVTHPLMGSRLDPEVGRREIEKILLDAADDGVETHVHFIRSDHTFAEIEELLEEQE